MYVVVQDSHLIDLRQFSYSGANITAFRLIDPERPQVVDIKTDWMRMHDAQEESPLDSNAGIRVLLSFSSWTDLHQTNRVIDRKQG